LSRKQLEYSPILRSTLSDGFFPFVLVFAIGRNAC
jgi:hypothetical protein